MSLEFPSNPFEKGVVVTVYTGQSAAPEFSKSLSDAKITVPLDRIPRNSVIVRRISRGADVRGSSYSLCYPFFSSHLSMPVKPAEVVWVIFDRDMKSIGYWLSRVHGDETSEDVNYSHFDRAFVNDGQELTTSERAGVAQTPLSVDDFPNISLSSKTGNNDYDLILTGASYSYSHTALEPVPRYEKRPGDLVIQGSNNTMISLTTDRGWAVDKDPSTSSYSNATLVPKNYSGTIDIVSGRSRWVSKPDHTERTIPPVRTNRRSFVEVAKRPSDFSNSKVTEGDPDFLDDASRLYVTSNSSVDLNFGLSNFTPAKFVDGEVPTNAAGSAIVAKADEIRIISRYDEANSVTGSIRIIKEGARDDDLAAILLHPDGIVQISAKEIHLGRSSNDGGLEEGDSEAPGTSQPYVRYKQLEDLLKAVIADVKSFCDTLSTHTTPGYGAPSPQINQAASALKSAMESRESEIPNLKSKRIFGE